MADHSNSIVASRRQALVGMAVAAAGLAIGFPALATNDRAAKTYIALWRATGSTILPDGNSFHICGTINLPSAEDFAAHYREFGPQENFAARIAAALRAEIA